MENEKLKRVNISLNKRLATAFDEFSKEAGLTKSVLIKDFIRIDNGKFEASLIVGQDESTTYNFLLEEDLYNYVSNLAKEHLTSVSNILRLIIAKNIQLSEKSGLPSLLNEQIKQQFENFHHLNTRIHDLDQTVVLLQQYSKAKNHKGFNFSTIKTYPLRKTLERISNRLHKYQAHAMNLFIMEKSKSLNQIESTLKDITKLISKYEVSLQYFETAIEFYDTQNPFYKRVKRKTPFQESIMKACMGQSDICEFLSDIKSNALILLGKHSIKTFANIKKEVRIMNFGPASYIGFFYILIGISNEIPIEKRKDFKAIIDIYESDFPKEFDSKNRYNRDKFLKECSIKIRVNQDVFDTSLNELILSLGFTIKNLTFNFIEIDLIGPNGAYLNTPKILNKIIEDKKKYDINLITTAEIVYPFEKSLYLLKNYCDSGAIIASSCVVYSGNEAVKIFHEYGEKRIENKLFSAGFRKIHHYLINSERDEFWLPITMRPDLRVEINDFYNCEGDRSEYLKKINNKGLYFYQTEKETHVLSNPLGCITEGIKRAKFVMKKENSINIKNQTADYICSVAVIKI